MIFISQNVRHIMYHLLFNPLMKCMMISICETCPNSLVTETYDNVKLRLQCSLIVQFKSLFMGNIGDRKGRAMI